ncbi:MAG: glycosyltransferase [Alphaproteobacteria bacterium]|nr:glycosyltransferase [Alphaproteobacteria bacterium]
MVERALQEKPGVSFVVPVYNKAPWLEDVLGRIRAQRGAFERQVVLVDDGSTDGSLEIVRRVTADWPEVVIESQPNAGSAAATNRGIALAEREFVKFVDADDLLHEDATQALLDALAAHPDACLAFGRAVRFSDRAALDLSAPIEAPPMERMERPLKASMANSLFNPTQFMARRKALVAVGGCDERIVFSQEYALTMRLARRWPFVKIAADIAFLPDEAAGRLSNNEGRQLQRVTRSLAYFLRDYPETPWALKQWVCKRMAYRAWKYLHRTERPLWLTHPIFWRQARCWLPILGGHAAFIEDCGRVFESADVRVADGAVGEATR